MANRKCFIPLAVHLSFFVQMAFSESLCFLNSRLPSLQSGHYSKLAGLSTGRILKSANIFCCQIQTKQTSISEALSVSSAPSIPISTGSNSGVVEKTLGQRRAQAERRLKGMREAAQRGTVPLKYVEIGTSSTMRTISVLPSCMLQNEAPMQPKFVPEM
jgi:hypothetical protein